MSGRLGTLVQPGSHGRREDLWERGRRGRGGRGVGGEEWEGEKWEGEKWEGEESRWMERGEGEVKREEKQRRVGNHSVLFISHFETNTNKRVPTKNRCCYIETHTHKQTNNTQTIVES